jgi:hypothetical protein
MPRPARTHRPRRLDGKHARRSDNPTPGWKAHATVPAFINPRPPSVPTTMDLRLYEYFAGAALMGVLASQADEPDPKWACEWSWKMGRQMAAHAVKLRKKRRA